MGRHTVSGPQRIQLDLRMSTAGGILDATSTSGNVALLASE
jgi:hypothetical protein